jgi:hypothetical protein
MNPSSGQLVDAKVRTATGGTISGIGPDPSIGNYHEIYGKSTEVET